MQWLDWLKNPDTLKAIANPVIGFILTGVLLGIVLPAYKESQKRRRQREIPAGNYSLLTLPPGSKDVLRQLMGGNEENKDDPLADFNITYQQRVPDREIRRELEEALNTHDWVLVLGKSGIGKSREVYHLAELWNRESWQVLKLKDGSDMWLDEPRKLPPEINPEQNVLFKLLVI